MLSKPTTNSLDGAIKRVFGPGDKLDLSENLIKVIDDNDAHTFTGQDIAESNVLEHTGTGGGAIEDTLPTAAQLVAALVGGYGTETPPDNAALYQVAQRLTLAFPGQLGKIPPGSSFRLLFRNSTGQTITLAAPASSGVTLSGTMTVATAKARLLLFRILNSVPAVTLSVTTTNNSKVLSAVSMELINMIVPGMSVYGTGIGAAAKVVSVNRDAGTINVDVNSTATANLIGVTFTPTYTVTNLGVMDI